MPSGALQEALAAREASEERVVVFSLSGHGHFDLSAYDDFKNSHLVDYKYPEEAIRESLAALPDVE